VYDWLLFFHLLAAFLLAVTAVTYSAVALGAVAGGRTLFVADRCWDVGGLGTLILGVWLALYLDQYEIWDAGSSERSCCGRSRLGWARAVASGSLRRGRSRAAWR
jgi:hypothetical protein